MPMPIRIVHPTSPRDDIMEDVGHLLKDFQVMAARVLVVVYERGKQKGRGDVKSAGGLIIPDTGSLSAMGNDKWQGKVGLVVGMGPLAFKEDANHKWGDNIPKIGDWVMYDVGNTSPFDLPGDRRARYVEDVHIDAVVPDVAFDAVW